MPRSIMVLLALLLASCETFTGPQSQNCKWRYTRYTGTMTVTDTVVTLVPTDSVYECRSSEVSF